ncbi:unnamed protein product [Lactuca virosa]|uniref:Uncharacterized protein n=1 Tax=Lactuca virosa TaxID=75947 RepID=A0AAU9N680_9ASTR|nr:unnamed protein product [Lactuca virosa]
MCQSENLVVLAALQRRFEEKVVACRSRYIMKGGNEDDGGGSPQQRQRRGISGSRSETPTTDVSVIVGGRRL